MCASPQDLNSRAQAEVTIREALRELDLWGAAATFNLTEYTDSSKRTITLIKDWKDIVNQVQAQSHTHHDTDSLPNKSKQLIFDEFSEDLTKNRLCGLFVQVGDNRCLLQSLKDSPYYHSFQDKVRAKPFVPIFIFYFHFFDKTSSQDFSISRIQQ